MATIVLFHAHPDDETIVSGGTMAKYAAAGHRVVLVLATKGEHGEVPDGFLDEGETLAERRVREAEASARILGVARIAYLGYVDSGMMDTPENDGDGSFWQADVDDAAARLAAILDEESCDVLVVYDENGGYGHPDHIQVHRVGVRAGELAGTAVVYEVTMNRDALRRAFADALASGVDMGEEAPDESFLDTLGLPESLITHELDVYDWIDVKRRAMAAHASQISETSFFLTLPGDTFRESFGREWFVRRGATPPGPDRFARDLFDAP